MANQELYDFLAQQEYYYFSNPLDIKKDIGKFTDFLNVDILTEAYLNAYFPWPDDSKSTEIPWANPRYRGIISIPNANIPKSVLKILKRKEFYLKIDTAFSKVIENCAQRNDGEDTWITSSLKEAYIKFHKAGWAHSFEAYDSQTHQLVGGLYGVSVGQVFCGESMFYRKSGASKFALAKLLQILALLKVIILDTQMVTSVMENFGAQYVDREMYLEGFYQFRGEPISTEIFREAARIIDEDTENY